MPLALVPPSLCRYHRTAIVLLMSYWQHVVMSAELSGYYPLTLACLVVILFALRFLAPDARRRLGNTLVLLLLSFAATLLAGALHRATPLSSFRWVQFFAELCFWIAALNIAGVVLFHVLLRRLGVRAAPILRDTLQGIAYVVAALSLLSHSGVDVTGVVATSAVVTAIIGFSLQDTLGNVMGGVALQLERSIAVGDWIRLGDTEGLVLEIRWRQTSIQTRNWDTVVIPNSLLMKSQVLVLGRRAGKPRLHRVFLNFNVDFRYVPGDVIGAVQKSLRAEAIAGVALEPPLECLLMEFRESYAVYAVRYWLSDLAADTSTSSEVRIRIYSSLLRAGIPMSIPAQSVFMTMENESRTKRKQEAELTRRVEVIKHIHVLEPLTDDERRDVADHLTPAQFAAGEVIVSQGAQAHHLYVIARGEVEVHVTAAGQVRTLASLAAGECFGEMGMLTGEPRQATVSALTATLCYKLDKASLTQVLRARPEVANAISQLLAERKIALDAATRGMDAEAVRSSISAAQTHLLSRIRNFFALND